MRRKFLPLILDVYVSRTGSSEFEPSFEMGCFVWQPCVILSMEAFSGQRSDSGNMAKVTPSTSFWCLFRLLVDIPSWIFMHAGQ